MNQPAPPDSRTASDREDAVRLLANLLGVPLAPERLPAVTDYLVEVLTIADDLRSLAPDDAEPGAIFDPRWPEAVR